MMTHAMNQMKNKPTLWGISSKDQEIIKVSYHLNALTVENLVIMHQIFLKRRRRIMILKIQEGSKWKKEG